MSIGVVIKRDGREVAYNPDLIYNAIHSAMVATNSSGVESVIDVDESSNIVANVVYNQLSQSTGNKISVEEIQDIVEEALIKTGYAKTAKAYILYRDQRNRVRQHKSDIMNVMREITFSASVDADIKRENGNVNTDSPMGAMLKYGSEISKSFCLSDLQNPEHAQAHIDGRFHQHDLDFYATGTETCCQIDIIKLFKNGFSTGHGTLREPGSIRSYASLACIAIQANQNDQHGGQSIPNFEYAMAEGVNKSFRKAMSTVIYMAGFL